MREVGAAVAKNISVGDQEEGGIHLSGRAQIVSIMCEEQVH